MKAIERTVFRRWRRFGGVGGVTVEAFGQGRVANAATDKGPQRGAMEKDCTFCKIVNGETDTEFLYQDEEMVVFKDINPYAPVHLLVVPRRHIRSVNDLEPGDAGLMGRMLLVARDAARAAAVAEDGYKLLFNVEWGAGQRVFHIHLHLLAGREWKHG